MMTKNTKSDNVQVITMGCRLNIFESELIKERAEKEGLSNLIIINSCTVTAEADKQTRQTIRKLKRNNPEAKIVITGCGAQVRTEEYAKMDEVSWVVGNSDKLNLSSDMLNNDKKIVVTSIEDMKSLAPHMISGFDNKTRAFLQIQQGCDHACTFCIIPQARGRNQSIEVEDIFKQIRLLLDAGHSEFVFTGVDISSYGRDKGLDYLRLSELCKMSLKEFPDIKRLRLSSIDPAREDKGLLDLLSNEPRFMPHVHLSLQAGSDKILRAMLRRHRIGRLYGWLSSIKKAREDVLFGADIITGFPTEEEEDFVQTLKLISDFDISFLHVFPYSEREGTKATFMEQVPLDIRKSRALRLRNLGEEIKTKLFGSLVNTEQLILVENNKSGYTEHYVPVKFINDVGELRNKVLKAKVVGVNKDSILVNNIY